MGALRDLRICGEYKGITAGVLNLFRNIAVLTL